MVHSITEKPVRVHVDVCYGVILSGKYKRSDVAVSKVPGRAGPGSKMQTGLPGTREQKTRFNETNGLAGGKRWSVTDRSATPQMDA